MFFGWSERSFSLNKGCDVVIVYMKLKLSMIRYDLCSIIFLSHHSLVHERRAFGKNIEHAILEFFVRNDAIFVLINFVHDLTPNLLSLLETYIAWSEDRWKFGVADGAITILVENTEGFLKVRLSEELDLVEGGRDELRVVHIAIAVRISLLHHCNYVLLL